MAAMQAGFGMQTITPALGTRLFGFGRRDRAKGCERIHDDLQVRALYLEQADARCLILGFDLLFFSRSEADRLKGFLSRSFDFRAREVLLNCSHTHAGPTVGDWGAAQPDRYYLEWLQTPVRAAVAAAMAAARPVSVYAGRTETRLPVSRRFLRPDGIADWRPAPDGEVYRAMPFCRFDAADGRPVGLLFSVACHPSTVNDFAVSADYPGVARRRLDAALGASVALFLQGCGGDSKACVIADGAPDETGWPTWRRGTAADIEIAGKIVADDLLAALDNGRARKALPGRIATRLHTVDFPLEPLPAAEALEAELHSADPVRCAWAERQAGFLRAGIPLPRAAPIQCQMLHLAENVRLVALEGEPVAGFGPLIEQAFPGEIVFSLGYSNGQGMYLPTERMFPERGYEVTSAYEYGFPSAGAPGFEARLRACLQGG